MLLLINFLIILTMKYQEIIKILKSNKLSKESKKNIQHFGVVINDNFAINIPVLRKLGKSIGKDHELALRLWKAGYHDSRILASYVDDPEKVTERQMELWTKGFDSWDIVDNTIGNLFDKTPYAWKKAQEWSVRKEEYVKRAGYVLMAELAVHDKKASDSKFEAFFPLIVKGSTDERNFVKKAVNWALRQIGKRNSRLRNKALKAAYQIKKINNKSARWVAADAIRELKTNL
jgi:3-methyladenine DNA glycosylase AlkD